MLARETKGFREQTSVRCCNGPNDGNRSRVVFDDHLGARAHAGHQRGEVAHRFRFRDADYILSHNVIIHRDSSSLLTPEGRIYIASGTWDLLGSVAVTMVPGEGSGASVCPFALSGWLRAGEHSESAARRAVQLLKRAAHVPVRDH